MFIMHRLAISLSLSVALITPLAAAPLSVSDAQNMALADNPKLAQIQARYAAAMEMPEQAGALPDPTITLGLLNAPTDTFDLNQEAMTQFQVGITQALPWMSERRLARSSALHRADAAAAEVEEARNLLLRDVTRSWWSLYFTERALTVVDENLQRLREFNRIAQSRYRVGEGLQQDTLQAQLQLSTQLERQLVLQWQRRNQLAQLNALLALPAEQTLEIDLAETPRVTELAPLDTLIETALQQRPQLHQQQRLVAAAIDQQALERESLLPDITLGAAYAYRQDAPNGNERADLFSLNVGIKVPLYASAKQHRAIAQRGAELIGQREALYSSQLNVRAEVVQASSDYRRTQEQIALLQQGMLPQAKQTVASMLAGYQVGKVDFSALIQAQLTVNQLQLQYWKAFSDGQQALASLNAALGGELATQAEYESHFNQSVVRSGSFHE